LDEQKKYIKNIVGMDKVREMMNENKSLSGFFL
jgi:hypothetical protein